MSTLNSMAKLMIQIHGAKAMSLLVKQKPSDARYIAVSKDKLASIFYKNVRGVFYMDSLRGMGWELVRQKSEKELIKDLGNISMLFTDIDSLNELLRGEDLEELADATAMSLLKNRVDSQIARVALRRDHDGEPNGYWQGQYEAYETVQHMMRECSC